MLRSRLAIVVSLGVAAAGAAGSAQAQTPTGGPPPEAIHCARPGLAPINSALNAKAGPRGALDTEQAKVSLAVDSVPSNATCYIIVRTPSEVNPVVFEWNAAGVAPKQFTDPIPFPASGTYCYELYFGNKDGISEPSAKWCVDIPLSMAPAPQATPTPARIVPPAAGTSVGPERGSAPAWWLLPAGAAISALAGCVGILLRRRAL